MKEDTKIIKIWGRFAPDLVLDCEDPGAQEFWKFAMGMIKNSIGSALRCNLTPENCAYSKMKQVMNKDKIAEYGASMGQVYAFNEINIPITTAKVTEIDGVYHIKFKDDYHFCMLMHELGHFEHFIIDRGVCHAPAYFGMETEYAINDGDILFIQEYESGYRSILWQKKFNVFPSEPTLCKEVNVANMFKFWYEAQATVNPEWRKKYEEACQACIGYKDAEERDKLPPEVVAAADAYLSKLIDTKVFTQFKDKWKAYANPRLDLSFIDIGVIK